MTATTPDPAPGPDDLDTELLAGRIRAATETDVCDLTMDEVAARAAALPDCGNGCDGPSGHAEACPVHCHCHCHCDDDGRADPDVMAMQDWDAAERDDDTIGDGIVLEDIDDVCTCGPDRASDHEWHCPL